MNPGLSSFFLLALLCCSPAIASDDEKIFEIDGRSRSYDLYMPENLPGNAPLVFVLHGYGQNGEEMKQLSKMNSIADQYGFAVCYPTAVKGEDNLNSWNAGYSNPDVDDVKFLSSLATYLQDEFNLSSQNTFCTGLSNGADMCYILACQGQDIFSAIAPVAGCMMKSTFRSCNQARPIPVFEIHGTDDSITFYHGDPNYSEVYGGYLGVPETIEFWVGLSGCSVFKSDTLHNMDPTDGSIVVTEKYSACADDNQVWLYKLVGGKHDWPGSWGNNDFIASEEIWRFFRLFLE